MQLSLTLMLMILMAVPNCWRCWFGGVLGRDTESVMNKIEDGDVIKRATRESVCLDRYRKESFLRYIACVKSLRSGRFLNLDEDTYTTSGSLSSVTRADNSFFLVGFAFVYPVSMIILGVILPK